MGLSSLTDNNDYRLRSAPQTHSVLFNNYAVRLRKLDFFVVERLLESPDRPISANELHRRAVLCGFKIVLNDIENCLSHLGFTLRYGLNIPISIVRSASGFQIRCKIFPSPINDDEASSPERHGPI